VDFLCPAAERPRLSHTLTQHADGDDNVSSNHTTSGALKLCALASNRSCQRFGHPIIAAARVVLYQRDALTPGHLAEVAGKQHGIDRIVRQVITDGVSAGDFDAGDIAGTATAVLSLCVDVARWYRPGHRRTPEEIGELNAGAVLRIVGAHPTAGTSPRSR
jgi:hypothetical protein